MSKEAYKILIIDDEREFCSLLKAFFEEEGWIVELSYNGKDGVEKSKHFEPAIILLDIRMPCMGGIEALKKIREFSSAPVICVSAISNKEMTGECLENGAFSYLSKPINLEDLSKSINSALASSNQ